MRTFSVIENEVSLRQAIELLLEEGSRVIFFLDEEARVYASFSEGDALRAVLAGVDLEMSVRVGLHEAPFTLETSTSLEEIRSCLKKMKHVAIPIVFENGQLEKVITYVDFI